MNKKIILFLSFLLFALNSNCFIDLNSILEKEARKILNSNPYKILGLDKNAKEEDVKNAFANLIRKYHPDKNKNISGDKKWVASIIIDAKNKILNSKNINSKESVQLDDELILKLKFFQLYAINKIFQFINIINEILKIDNIGCTKESKIRFNANLNQFFHIFSFLLLPYRYLISFSLNLNFKNNPVQPMNKLVYCARWANILPSLFGLRFAILDYKIQKNAKKIAENNFKNNDKINFKIEKLKQYIWLAFNKMMPYLGLYYFGKKHSGKKHETLTNLFKKIQDINDKSYDNYYIQIFEIFNSLSNISEIFRNYSRYNLILKSLRK